MHHVQVNTGRTWCPPVIKEIHLKHIRLKATAVIQQGDAVTAATSRNGGWIILSLTPGTTAAVDKLTPITPTVDCKTSTHSHVT